MLIDGLSGGLEITHKPQVLKLLLRFILAFGGIS
jgi:hypothetical protein